VLAGLAATEAEQNARLVAALLAADGVPYLSHETVADQLATHLAASPAVVANGYPPYGAERMIYVTDTDGPGGRVQVGQLREKDPADVPVDRIVLDMLGTAKQIAEVHVVNGLVAGSLTRALAGELVGTVIAR
jgi:molybdenum storage protein